MALYSVAKDRDLAITEAPTSRRGAGCQRQLAWLRFSLFRLKPIFFQVCAHCEQLDSQYCATLVAFQRPNATVRYVSGSNCPLYIDFLFPSIGSICKIFLLKMSNLLFSQLLPLAAGCDDAPRGEKKPRPRFLSTRRRNRVLTKIHLIYSVIDARAASNEDSKWNSPHARAGAEAQGKYLCRVALLLSSSYPEEFRPYRPQIPPPFTQIGPRLAPTSTPTSPPPPILLLRFLFSHLEFNESWQTREEGIINFLSLKKTRLTHIC